MNTTFFYRSTHNIVNPYLKLSSKLIKDDRLNAISIGLMCIILNNNDNYVINAVYIKKISKLTKNQFNNAWNTLQKYQYIIIKYVGNHSWHYIINENGDSEPPSRADLRGLSKDNQINYS